jgi:hypothetical protein
VIATVDADGAAGGVFQSPDGDFLIPDPTVCQTPPVVYHP